MKNKALKTDKTVFEMSSKPIGQIIGDLTAILFIKNVITYDEFIKIIGEDNYKKILKEVKDNG